MRKIHFMVMASLAWLVSASPAWACAACYGKVDERTITAVNFAIFTLLAVLGGVLGSFLVFIFYLKKRARMASGMDAI